MKSTSASLLLLLLLLVAACDSQPTSPAAPTSSDAPPAESATPGAAGSPEARPNAVPLPLHAKRKAGGVEDLAEAFYPSPMVVHRCLALAASGPAGSAREVCERALAVEPRNERILSALGSS